MTYFLALLLVLLIAAVVRVGLTLHEDLNNLREETRTLRLDSRAHISTARVRTGPDEGKEVRVLRRHGASTKSRRIVVGGEPDSEQFQKLQRQTPQKED